MVTTYFVVVVIFALGFNTSNISITSQVSIVATAPLTNLALAVRLDPTLPQKLKSLYIMGGNTDCKCTVHCPLP